MKTTDETGARRSRFKVMSLTLLVGLATPYILRYVGALEPTWLATLGIVALFLLVAEVFFFQLDVFNLSLSHRDAVQRMTGKKGR